MEDKGELGHSTTSLEPNLSRQFVVSADIELPFSAETAFDAFANLPRQASWSPWLRSVEYIDSTDNVSNAMGRRTISNDIGRRTRWHLRYMGIRLSWVAISTRVERPTALEWESTKGLKNYGKVLFTPNDGSGDGDKRTTMKLTMTFVLPTLVAGAFKNRTTIQRLVGKRMLQTTLRNFRDVVLEEDVQPMQ